MPCNLSMHLPSQYLIFEWIEYLIYRFMTSTFSSVEESKVRTSEVVVRFDERGCPAQSGGNTLQAG